MHRTDILKRLSFSRVNGGKYSDVAALTQLASRGKIVWLSEAHMQYRIHAGQNSQSVSTREYRSLINYLIDNEWLPGTSPLFQSYRFKHMRLKLPTMNKQTKAEIGRVDPALSVPRGAVHISLQTRFSSSPCPAVVWPLGENDVRA